MILPDAKLYIDGEVRDASDGATFEVTNPWTGELAGRAADASPDDVEAAIAAARRAFDATDWAHNHGERLRLVKQLRALFEQDRERLATLARFEAGAALGAVHTAHVATALDGWDDLIAVFPDVHWEEDRGTRLAWGSLHARSVIQEPLGVVGAITPWNVPLYVNIGKVVAALLAGCTVILKPAPDTPGMGAIFGELAAKAGFPAGVLNVVLGADPVLAGEMLTIDPRVDVITFTGSTGVGRRIMEKGAATLKRVFLELGGKSAKIVLDDAPQFQADIAQSMLVFHAGQGCAVTSRLLVQRSRYDEAVAILEASYRAYEPLWGDPGDPANVMGPLISQKQLDCVLSYIEIGKREGARLIAGGRARPDKGRGFFVEPTCFVDATNAMRIAREEIFGPVLTVIPFEDDADAIRIANDSEYGLSGAVCGSIERAMKLARAVRTGSIGINGGVCTMGDVPFGGYKASGIGREWGAEGIEEFLQTKVIGIPA